MLKRWFEGGMKESPDQMAELALKMMTGSITEQ
jgi:hypothetical protein